MPGQINTFLSPANTMILGKTDYTINGQPNILIFDDVQHVSFTTPLEQKPIMQLGSDKANGYSTGQKLNAGTMQLHITQQPSIMRLFEAWISMVNKQLGNTDTTIMQFSATDLPLFDMAIIHIPEKQPTSTFAAQCYAIKGVKIIEVDTDISAFGQNQPISLYRFVQQNIQQKSILIDPGTGLDKNIDVVLKILEPDSRPVITETKAVTKTAPALTSLAYLIFTL